MVPLPSEAMHVRRQHWGALRRRKEGADPLKTMANRTIGAIPYSLGLRLKNPSEKESEKVSEATPLTSTKRILLPPTSYLPKNPHIP